MIVIARFYSSCIKIFCGAGVNFCIRSSVLQFFCFPVTVVKQISRLLVVLTGIKNTGVGATVARAKIRVS